MKKLLYGVVFALPADKEYRDMAHLWVRDAETADWFSLSRPTDSDVIEVMASNRLIHTSTDLSVMLSPTGILIKVSPTFASVLDGHLEYAIEFHPESEDLRSIGETLEVIFRGKSGLQVHN
jgi:hypothetical protein